jgi:DNA-binding NtrC family response regulator
MVIFGDENAVLRNKSGERMEDGIPPESHENLLPIPRREKKSFNLKDVGRKAAEDAERKIIENALLNTHWNRKQAAKLLHVSYKALLYKIQKYHLNDLKGYRRTGEGVG